MLNIDKRKEIQAFYIIGFFLIKMIFYYKNIGKMLDKMLDRDMAYAPVAPNWINFDYYNITVEGCRLYYNKIGPCPGCCRTLEHFWVNKRPKGPHIVHLSTICHLFEESARAAALQTQTW